MSESNSSIVKAVLDYPPVYRLWQAPFANQKLAPVTSAMHDVSIDSVLDVGCGPGTNSDTFKNVPRYVGLDISERYIQYARERYRGTFLVHDVTREPPLGESFDAILLNSLMHHLDDPGVDALISSLPTMLKPGGDIHIVDLVRAERGLPRLLAKADRGAFARTVAEWESLIRSHIRITHSHRFYVGFGPFRLWELIYVRGRPR